MATQPDWRADPTMATHREPPQDPWSDYPPQFPAQFPAPGYVPGMAVPPAPPTLPDTKVEPKQPGRRRPSPDEPWVGSAAVTPPKPAPTEELIEPDPTSVAPAATRAKRQPYVRPDLPKPRKPRAWHAGRSWSVWGSFLAFCCWGVWAANNRGKESAIYLLGSPVAVLGVGVLVFVVSRLIGRVLIGSWRTQPRGARMAHFITFMYFVAAGLGYLKMTSWITDANTFLQQFR